MCAALRQYSSRAQWMFIYASEVHYIWMRHTISGDTGKELLKLLSMELREKMWNFLRSPRLDLMLNSQSASYICDAPPERKINLRCALFVDLPGDNTYKRKDGNYTSLSYTLELNSSKPRLYLVQFKTWQFRCLNISTFANFSASLEFPGVVQISLCFYLLRSNLLKL